ncbi:MAG: 16S rRNA (adenine(1518)-N(6)/adenine(1519)-N(6))-dimethyltransferase RsmA [Gammaproteobacteria bacterium]|nr:16S rRNA (adenine(1518)-N(6)/adenine(1519)-N(6))-dimethyltransferase RsmA [Gammaproteobacteria bacterium]
MGNPPPHRARKRFGQHFLHDQHVIHRMLDAINPQPGQSLIEIGPGRGALTFPLLERCKQLTAIELDRDLIVLLQEKSRAFGQIHLISADVLKIDLSTLDLPTPYRLVGNLPYNISTPLMFHLLEYSDLIEDMHFMVQKEVAQRIIAGPGSKHYGRLSVMLQYHCQCDYLFDVAPGSFSPPPKVDSAIIRLLPHASLPHPVANIEQLALVVQSAFSQRRKTIHNSLKTVIDCARIAELDIDPGARAENLGLEDFVKLTTLIIDS